MEKKLISIGLAAIFVIGVFAGIMGIASADTNYNESINVSVNITPETLNLRSKGVFTAFITLPEDYNVTDINISTVECEDAPADSKKRIEGDTFIAKFNRQEVNVSPDDEVTLNVTGKLNDGTPFEGNDTIRVIDGGRWGSTEFGPGHWFSEVKKWAKKVHKKFLPSDDDAIAIPGNPGKATERVFVSGKPASTSIVKSTFAVQHEFEDGFTVAVSAKGLAALEKIPGIDLKPVPLYHVLEKPGCECDNDGICEPEIGEHPSCCADCKGGGEEPTPPERACYPSEERPWGIVKVNGGSGGAGVKVAVLDTGVYKDHLDLKANILDCKDATTRGIRKGCADNNGHGTHVAGTIAANGGSDGKGIIGVAPEAKLMAIKVCGPGGCWADDIAAGIKYAARNGANIISMSLGGNTQSPLIEKAIDDATGKDVLVVAAAGNYHPIYNPDNVIQYPAANDKVVAVAAFNSSDKMAYFSSLGVNDNSWTIEEREIEFAAPGVDVESTWNDGGYNTISGTSMSTPHISGIAARDWNGSASATRAYLQELAEYYTKNVKDYGQPEDDIEAGFGLPIAP